MRRVVDLFSPAIGASGTVIAYGHWGRPVLVFPSEAGRAGDFEANGMVDAVADLLDAGRVALLRRQLRRGSWSNRSLPLEERARRHGAYESWILDQVVPFVHGDCGGPLGVLTTGVSMGAFHAANFALRRADHFPQALCLSGNYDPSTWHGWGEQGEALYFQNPTAYVANLHGDHLDWLRRRPPHARLRAGHVGGHHRGVDQHAHTLAGLLAGKGIPTSSTSGGTTWRTTGRGGGASSPTTCTGWPDGASEMKRHLIGLLLGTEEDWPAAFETIVRRMGAIRTGGATSTPSTSNGSRSSRSTCATSRATTWSSTGSPTGTTSPASGSRRSR